MRKFFVALILGTLATSSVFAKEDDTILMAEGKSVTKVDVVQEKFAEVKYRERGQAKTEVGRKIIEIIHGDAPRSFVAAEGQRKGGQYDKAVKSYEKAIEEAGSKDWVKVYANYFIGECLRLSGKGKDAVGAYKKAVQIGGKDHLIYPRILVGMGRAQAEDKDYAAAVGTLKEISDGAFGVWRARADFALGEALLSKGDMAEARRAFARVQSQSDDRDMQQAGVVGEGQTYMAEKNFRKANEFFNRILSRSDLPRDVAAGAWAGIGDCEAAGGDKDGDKKALKAYLVVVVQFAGVPGAYPKALAGAAKLYDKFGQKEAAKALRRELKSRAPSSPEAKALKD